LKGAELKVLKYDDYILSKFSADDKTAYLKNVSAYSEIPFKPKKSPINAWAVPYVTNHKYKVHWRYGIDFTSMQLDLSDRWSTTDKNIYLIFNHTDVRA
jgi:hypothetical protein